MVVQRSLKPPAERLCRFESCPLRHLITRDQNYEYLKKCWRSTGWTHILRRYAYRDGCDPGEYWRVAKGSFACRTRINPLGYWLPLGLESDRLLHNSAARSSQPNETCTRAGNYWRAVERRRRDCHRKHESWTSVVCLDTRRNFIADCVARRKTLRVTFALR